MMVKGSGRLIPKNRPQQPRAPYWPSSWFLHRPRYTGLIHPCEPLLVRFQSGFPFKVLNHPNLGLPANQLYTGNVPQFRATPSAAQLAALPCKLTAAQAIVDSCNPQAGVITTANPARQIQLSLKVVF